MKRIHSALVGIVLTFALAGSTLAASKNCCNGDSCCNGQSCCRSAKTKAKK